MQSLRAQEAQLKVQYADAAVKYGSRYPKLAQLRNQVAEIEASIQSEIQKLAARAENDYIAAKHSERMLRDSFSRQKSEATKVSDKMIQYAIMKREVESSRTLYEDLLTKLKEAGVIGALRSTNIVVIDPARATARPIRPNYPLNLALGAALGLLGGLALASAREDLDNTLRTPGQVEVISALPSVGIIPDAQSSQPRLPRSVIALPDCGIIENSSSQMAEAYRALRTSILFTEASTPRKVMVITSALPREGKSTTSLNTAITLARHGSKVLLIDADLRHPTMQQRLKLPSSPGLSGVLSGTHDFEADFTCHPDIPDLSVLPAGPKSRNPAELLASKRMGDFLGKLRDEFDFIIIDAPPVLSVTDAVSRTRYCWSFVPVRPPGSRCCARATCSCVRMPVLSAWSLTALI
jgi:polysaccharide biosynthesis transport protein